MFHQIRQYGSLPQWSTESQEHAHKINLKDGWNSPNHNVNYLPQILSFHRHILCFEIRELNTQALNQDCPKIERPSSKDPKLQFIGPQNQYSRNHPDALIKDFRTLLHLTKDLKQREAIYYGTHGSLKKGLAVLHICMMII
jgi:hypothetical protein